MTVCIAAMCGAAEDDARVVVAADRMVTTGDFMEFEHPGSKIVKLSKHALLMVAGATNDGMRLARQASAEMGGTTGEIAEVAEEIGRRYAEARKRRAEQILGLRGLDFESYYAMHANLNGPVVKFLDERLASYNLGVTLLLAGVDDAGAHVHTNQNPGNGNQCHDSIGWHAIGSGSIHVIPSMAGFEHSPRAGYRETLFRVYASKRRAEVAPGVGRESEVAVISQEGVKWLSSDELEQLDSIYDRVVSKNQVEQTKQMDTFKQDGDENAPE